MQILKFIIIPFLIIVSILTPAQTVQKIDKMIIKVEQLSREGHSDNAMKLAFDALKLSEEINYDKGKEGSLYSIASILSNIGDYENSIKYIQKAEQYKTYLYSNIDAQIKLLVLQIFNYNDLGFPSVVTQKYQQALSIASSEKNFKKRNSYLFGLYTISHLVYKKEEECYPYFLKAKAIINNNKAFDEKESPEDILMKKADVYGKLATYNLYKKELDSSLYYYTLIESLTKKMKNGLFVKGIVAQGYSEIAEEKGEYFKAINYLTETEEIFKSFHIYPNLIPVYESKFKLYSKIGDFEKEKKYFNLYKKYSDSLQNATGKGRDQTLISIVNSKEQELKEFHQKRFIKQLIGFVSVGIVICVIVFLLFKKYNKDKQKTLSLKEIRLQENQNKLIEKEEEIKILSSKINDSINNLSLLAKENSPSFFTKFQEVYPMFTENLLKANNGLTKTELIFCAYTYLGFTTKDIAAYTYKAPKSVENIRYYVRKKLNFLSHQDFTIALRGIVEQQ